MHVRKKYLTEKLDEDGNIVPYTRVSKSVYLCAECDLTGNPDLEFDEIDG